MKVLHALGVLAIATSPFSAYAIDCAKASSSIDHMICSDQKLVRADAAMNHAYAAILKAAPDPQINDMLINSQKRWISARNEKFGSDGRIEGAASKAKQRSILVAAIDDRTKLLTNIPNGTPRQFYLLLEALRQRRFAAQFTDGPFAGYDTSCDFLPNGSSSDDVSYACFATHHLQNNDRICSEKTDWATYRVYSSGSVADVVEGRPKLSATCNDDGCTDDNESGWNTHPDSAKAEPFQRSLPKLDAEVQEGDEDNESWLKTCLTNKHFPSVPPHK